jgi:hypothetical protein
VDCSPHTTRETSVYAPGARGTHFRVGLRANTVIYKLKTPLGVLFCCSVAVKREFLINNEKNLIYRSDVLCKREKRQSNKPKISLCSCESSCDADGPAPCSSR